LALVQMVRGGIVPISYWLLAVLGRGEVTEGYKR
jgi:hypothetical protein